MTESTDAISALTVEHPSPGKKYYPPFQPTADLEKEAKEYVSMYPEGKELSAVLPIIHMIQGKFGYICPESMSWIAQQCKCTEIHVAGIVSFYPGIRTRCPGKWHIRVCHTIACALSGGEELIGYICEKLGIDPKELSGDEPMGISPDGLWSIEPVECLANCGFGPNLMVNDTLYSQMDKEKVDKLLAEYAEKA